MNMDIESALKYIHWPSIRVAVWFSVFVLGGCISLLTAATTIQSALHGRLLLEKDRLEDFRHNYEQALIETRLITRYHDDYQKLVQQKFVGNEDRLSWVEAIKQVRDERILPSLSYTFQPIAALPNYPGISTTDFRLHATENVLEFSLYDETDLEAIFQRLSTSAKGYYTVENCMLDRALPTLELSNKGNIKGQCTIKWLSLKRITPTKGEDQGG